MLCEHIYIDGVEAEYADPVHYSDAELLEEAVEACRDGHVSYWELLEMLLRWYDGDLRELGISQSDLSHWRLRWERYDRDFAYYGAITHTRRTRWRS